jgi:hypothetical protein
MAGRPFVPSQHELRPRPVVTAQVLRANDAIERKSPAARRPAIRDSQRRPQQADDAAGRA